MLFNQFKKQIKSESLFERACREERQRKRLKNDGLYFGLCVLLAAYASEMLITIQ